jgi:hypothetical protein
MAPSSNWKKQLPSYKVSNRQLSKLTKSNEPSPRDKPINAQKTFHQIIVKVNEAKLK